MRERMRKWLAWCLAAVLLLGLLPLSPRATAAGGEGPVPGGDRPGRVVLPL